MNTPDSDEADRDSADPPDDREEAFEFETQPEAPERRTDGNEASPETDDGEERPDRPGPLEALKTTVESLEATVESLETTVDSLQTENDRLRADYARGRAASYRETALALAVVGVLAVLGGFALPEVRSALFITGSIGLFGAAMTRYLTPERVVPIAVSESVYDAAATTLVDARNELGLQPMTVYLPVGDRVRGFVPRRRDFDVPEDATSVFVSDDDASRGLSFAPAGARLAEESERLRTVPTPETALPAAERVAETLVEHFEIADQVAVDADEDTETPRLVVSARNAVFGPLTRPDHPVVSALACEVARSTDAPVIVDPIDDTTVALVPELPVDR